MGTAPKLVSACDESGVLCVYGDGDGSGSNNGGEPQVKRRSYVREVLDVFLPAGYPHTVTPDYTPYQIYVSFLYLSLSLSVCLYIHLSCGRGIASYSL